MEMKSDLKVDEEKENLIDKQVLFVNDSESRTGVCERIFHLRYWVGKIYEDLKEEDYNLVCVLSFFSTVFLFFNAVSTDLNIGVVDNLFTYAQIIFYMAFLVFSAFLFHYGVVIIFFALVSFFVKLTKERLSYFYKKRFLKTGKSIEEN